MERKTCITCGHIKPITEFVKTRKYYRRVCKQCLQSTYCACGNKSYGRKICSPCARHYTPDWKNRLQTRYCWLSQCLRSTKACSPSRAARGYRIRENDLTIEFLLELWDKQRGLCYISGIEMKTQCKNVCSASIDRIDHTRGYLCDNVVLTCQWVNLGRKQCPIEQFRSILLSIDLTVSLSETVPGT